MDSTASVEALCELWLSQDRNEATRREILALQANHNHEELVARLGKRIAFGTAGLRARMEAGFSRMNDLTVLQASQGLCAYILKQKSDATDMGVVIGHDHRHNSARFAALTANVFLRAGFRVYALKGLSCTPLVPFSVGRLKAAAGIMITASHNPAMDNGYKVYWHNGVQIIPPHDSGIADSIDEHLSVSDEAWNIDSVPVNVLNIDQTERLQSEYIESIAHLCRSNDLTTSGSVSIVYTPMHGVGLPFAKSALSAVGLAESRLLVVDTQAKPDPDFPTVKFPNPEEKGALDQAIAYADKHGVSIVCANDPDADRFCAAEKTGTGWHVFTGDQMGVMLGVWLFRQYKRQGKPVDKLAMLASTVSSKMLAVVAKAEGFHFKETLTGFKWLGNGAQQLDSQGYTSIFAYEEAIGFMVSTNLRDKDGISALAVFTCMADALYSSGSTLKAYLDSLYERYGQFANLNSYWVCRSPEKIRTIFGDLRKSSASGFYPVQLGKRRVRSLRDITTGYDSSESDQKLKALPVDASGQMLSFELDTSDSEGIEGLVGTVRTSGTEPKIKYYLEGWGSDKSKVVTALHEIREALASDWMRVKEMALEEPST